MPVARTNEVAVTVAGGPVLVLGGVRGTESERFFIVEALRFVAAS